jgi:cytochrome b involved in lipid metabolism
VKEVLPQTLAGLRRAGMRRRRSGVADEVKASFFSTTFNLFVGNTTRDQTTLTTMGGKALTGAEVAKHNSRDSCWIIVHGQPLHRNVGLCMTKV